MKKYLFVITAFLLLTFTRTFGVSLWKDLYSYSGTAYLYEGILFYSNPAEYSMQTNCIKTAVIGGYSFAEVDTYTPSESTKSGEKTETVNTFSSFDPVLVQVSAPVPKGVALVQFLEVANYKREADGGAYNDDFNPPLKIGSAYVKTSGHIYAVRFGYAGKISGISIGATAGYVMESFKEESLLYELSTAESSAGVFEFRIGTSIDLSRFSKLSAHYQIPAHLEVGYIPASFGLSFSSEVVYPMKLKIILSAEYLSWDSQYSRTSTVKFSSSILTGFGISDRSKATLKVSYHYLPRPDYPYLETSYFSTSGKLSFGRISTYLGYSFRFTVAPNSLPWFSSKAWHRETCGTITAGISYDI